jgi:glycosyltransferase involved in cell wall biosynthesis
MKKILFNLTDSNLTGSSLVILDLILKIDDFKVYIHISQKYGEIIKLFLANGIICSYFPKYESNSKLPKLFQRIIYIFKYFLLILKIRPEIFYYNTIYNVEELVLGRMFSKNLIMHVHEPNSFINNYSKYLKIIYFLDVKFIVLSNKQKKLIESFAFNKDKVYLVKNGLDCYSTNFRIRSINPIVNISIVGTIDRNKSQIEGVKILKIIKNLMNNNKIIMNIYGRVSDRNYYNEIVQYISEVEMSDSIIFHGESMRAQIYDNTDILLVTSLEESFGMVILEAFANSIPVVSTINGGAEEIINHGNNGQLYNYGDCFGAAKMVFLLLNDNIFLSKTVFSAFNDVKNNFSINIIKNKIINIVNNNV